jgi:hypothetical protein
MNLEQAKLLVKMAQHIKEIPFCNTTNGVWLSDDREVPGCLICNAVRAGIITKEQNKEIKRRHYWGIDHQEGFSPFFGCSVQEALKVIFHCHLRRTPGVTSGQNYYVAIRELLEVYGYGHLLEPAEVIPIRQIIPAYKDQFTPAAEGFDWRNPVAVKA